MPAFAQSIGRPGDDEPAEALAEDVQRVVVVLVDGDPERADRLDRRLGVGGAAEARDARLAVAERAEQHRAVRDRLVAGHRDVADEAGDRLDPHSSITGATTTPYPCASSSAAARSASASPATMTVSVPPRSVER